jgi:hypothetical protein
VSDARALDGARARAAAAPAAARAQHALGVLLLEGGAAEDLPRAAVERACKHQRIDLRQIRADLEREGARPTPAALAARAFGDVRLRMADRLRQEAAGL